MSRHVKTFIFNMLIISGIILKDILKKRGITQQIAADKLGVSRQTLNTWTNRSSLDENVISLLREKLDIDLLRVVQETEESSSPRLEVKPISLHDPDGHEATGEKIYELPDGSKVMEVPIVQAKTYAGYLRGFSDPEFYEDLPTLKVSVNNYHKGTYLAFEVVGDSATPTDVTLIDQAILEGWKVVGREVPKHHWQYKLHTHNYNYWIIVHKTEGILLKQIINQDLDKGEITIHSINPKYPDEVIKLDDVEQIFNVVKREVSERN